MDDLWNIFKWVNQEKYLPIFLTFAAGCFALSFDGVLLRSYTVVPNITQRGYGEVIIYPTQST